MNNLLQIAIFFFIEFAFGSILMLPFFPLKVTGKLFFRFYYGLIFVFLLLTLLTLWRLDGLHANHFVFLALTGWIWGNAFRKDYHKVEFILLWFNAFIALVVILASPSVLLQYGPHMPVLLKEGIFFLVAAIFLASHIMNMIFGHWYLVNRSLPIGNLVRSSKWLIYISYARCATVLIALFFAYKTLPTANFHRLTQDFMEGHAIFFWGRVLAGLLIPTLVAHLSYESAKIKANQSATGILYAGNIFVIMGEMLALYLFAITEIMF